MISKPGCGLWLLCLLTINLCWLSAKGFSADQPQWGEAWTRNMVSREKGLPDSFDPESGENVRWSAKLGTQTFSTPIVAGGRVYIGTNNEGTARPEAPRRSRGVDVFRGENRGVSLATRHAETRGRPVL